MTLGERIKYERKARKWTQADLASRVGGVTPAYISMLEAGKRDEPSRDILRRLAAAFGMSVTELEGEPDIFDGPWPDATIAPMGLSEEFLAKYRRLWPYAAKADRVWMIGFFRLVADAERRVQALEAAADEPDGPAPAAPQGLTIAGHVIA